MADVVPPPPSPPEGRSCSPAAFRRAVYQHNLWARPRLQQTESFRDGSPEYYRNNNPQLHRLVPWLNRELHYLLNENIGHMSYVVTRILELLAQYHINSNEFREAMQSHFGDRTDHFLHELNCFSMTPYDLQGYDHNMEYTTYTRIATMINEVIQLVPNGTEPPPGPSRLPAHVDPQNNIPLPPVNTVIPTETISHSDTDNDSDVMVVGYTKPPLASTPEVVDLLSSDSDVVVQDSAQSEATQGLSQAMVSTVNCIQIVVRQLSGGETVIESDYDVLLYRQPSPRLSRRRTPSTYVATSSNSSTTSGTAIPSITAATSTRHSRRIVTPSPASIPSQHSSPYSDRADSSNDADKNQRPKNKSKRKKMRATAKNKNKKRSTSRSHHRYRSPPPVDGDRNGRKRKSHSGKDVKSSHTAAAQPPADPGQSSTSSLRSDDERMQHRSSGESKRLRRVVNVMISQNDSSSSNSSLEGIAVRDIPLPNGEPPRA